MPWTYSQSTGSLTQDGEFVATGYSGAGSGRNNPAEQAVPNVGPIPRGRYSIGPPFETVKQGECVMRLMPDGHNALGRSGLLIHGDNLTHDASTGCIILSREVRDRIAASPDHELEVGA
jgi:Protein of unknown function (DUF2778)